MRSFVLGIDIGGSGSRVAIREVRAGGADAAGGAAIVDGPDAAAGTRPRRRELAGERVGITATGSSVPETALALLRAAHAAWPEEFGGARAAGSNDTVGRIVGVGLGATGLATLVEQPERVAESLQRELASMSNRADAATLPPVAVAIDAVTAHLGALAGAGGAIVALGTGAIAFGTDGRDVWRRVDGWGHLLGDRGGGAWIGLRGLDAAIRAHDGVDDAGTALLAAARRRFGEVPTWPSQLYTRADRAGVLAGFTADVATLAAAGDLAAGRIMTDAGTEAARSVLAALAPGIPPRVAATGGLVAAGGALAAAFAASIAARRPDVEIVAPLGDPLDGALLLAERVAGGVAPRHPSYVWSVPRVA
ncbi:MAG TPA: BadF/BadG/BcrA/BcrD ATPase family protein [Agromyces sp.]|nr:BadF/BadG/BcrA/BcrD ATPase family protein [Agromyces sp.]